MTKWLAVVRAAVEDLITLIYNIPRATAEGGEGAAGVARMPGARAIE